MIPPASRRDLLSLSPPPLTMIVRRIVGCALATLVVLVSVAPAPGVGMVGDASDAGFTPRLVVRFTAESEHSAQRPEDRVAQLARDTGIPLTYLRTMAVGAQVLTSSSVRSIAEADA